MIKEVEELANSISGNQLRGLKSALGNRIFVLLENVLDSETEEEAESSVKHFVEEAKKNIGKVFKARKILDDRQVELILKFLDN